ncbi:MAG TPA: type II toxin-antitoxin system ParD family antitoxin [Tepidisphaeraceae bacterium]|nr:type II toxin-antitoxin system ParD family antitoxin [Tepidisphaeraceae bacterium]
MPAKQITRNIALTPHLDRFVQTTVDSGRYQSASEVVREGLRLLEEREQERLGALSRLRQEIEIGWRQSERGEVNDGAFVFAEIRRESKARRKIAKIK